jgi:hypothetical protein
MKYIELHLYTMNYILCALQCDHLWYIASVFYPNLQNFSHTSIVNLPIGWYLGVPNTLSLSKHQSNSMSRSVEITDTTTQAFCWSAPVHVLDTRTSNYRLGPRMITKNDQRSKISLNTWFEITNDYLQKRI